MDTQTRKPMKVRPARAVLSLAAALSLAACASAPPSAPPPTEITDPGGFTIIEFTLNTPGALDHLSRFTKRDDLLVGAGTEA